MIVAIYDKRIDIGSRDDIDSISFEQSGYLSKLFVTYEDGDISSYEVEHKFYVKKNRWCSKEDTLQKFLETSECKALFFDSHFDFNQYWFKQDIRFMNECGAIYYDYEKNLRLISIGGYDIVKDNGCYIAYRKLPESLIGSFKEAYGNFQVIYKLDILKVMDSKSKRCKVKVFRFNGKSGAIIKNKETGQIKIKINLGIASVEFDDDLSKVSKVFEEEFASAFKGELEL